MAPLVMGLGVDPAAATPQFRPPAADEDDTPLSVTLTAMTPSEIPRKGAITLRGVVTNASEESVDGHQRLPVHRPGADHLT